MNKIILFKSLFILLGLLIASQSFAGRVIMISFCNDDEGAVGASCAMDQQNMQKFLRRISKALDYKPEEHFFIGDDFTKENFDEAFSKIHTKASDIIIFYVSCHGGRSVYDKTIFPQVQIGGKLCSVYEKYELLKKLPHKSLLVVIDACNVFRNITPKEITLFPKAFNPNRDSTAIITYKAKRNAKRLLLDNYFDVIVTSSKPGVSSLPTERGSIFTNMFISAFYYYMNIEDVSLASMSNVLTKSYETTLNESTTLYKNNHWEITEENQPHYPVWEPNPVPGQTKLVIKDIESDVFSIGDSTFHLTEEEKKYYGVKNDYSTKLWVLSNPENMSRIASVKYIYHARFRNPVATIKRRREDDDFANTVNIWGGFVVNIEITLKNNTVIDLIHNIDIKNAKP